jgi:hypothetical protein
MTDPNNSDNSYEQWEAVWPQRIKWYAHRREVCRMQGYERVSLLRYYVLRIFPVLYCDFLKFLRANAWITLVSPRPSYMFSDGSPVIITLTFNLTFTISVSEKGVIKQLPRKTNKFIMFCWYVDSLAVWRLNGEALHVALLQTSRVCPSVCASEGWRV